jgi:hypothetical protein
MTVHGVWNDEAYKWIDVLRVAILTGMLFVAKTKYRDKENTLVPICTTFASH